MAKFLYVAKNYDGETKTGEMVAKDERSLAQQLKSDGFLVTSVKEIEGEDDGEIKVNFMDRFSSVSLSDKMMFARNLSVMTSSGLTIAKAIKNLSIQTQNKKFSQILSAIHEDIREGKNLSDSMARFPGVFSELFVNMVKIGEIGGNLEETLQIVATQLEKEHSLRSKVRGAMIYPSVILVAMTGVAFLMLTYILPQITGVFKDMEVELPKSTQFVVNLSEFLSAHSLLSLGIIVSAVAAGKIFFSTLAGKKALSFSVLKIPGIKSMVIKVNCARFSRIYSSLLKSGVSSIDALKIVSNTLSNYYYKKALNESVKQIQKGVDLSEVIGKNKDIFPVLVSQMIEVGEQTGETEAVLIKMAEFYENQVDQATKNISSIIEPVLMIVMGVGVGFFAVSMLQPMYGLMENIK
ncbi:MAG: type II secretion system F family protein [Candidatus Moranbacteria bacterium]|jgi:type IV pilus assembly protein PilC|nr:type II secretion system F family protein [Candidatus Moranbacteria bacterium]MDD5652011.1 type II secretion system F family protein [Candidatus Moranbacteria bacterium]MDX9855555.1 type II secretion system F family protein [Candidatus Moranbacteria bacterium]